MCIVKALCYAGYLREAFVDEGETNHGKCVVWPNDPSSPTAGGGSGGAQPKDENEK
jgi:hypothetical protein